MDDAPSAAEALAELTARRDEAEQRVRQLEQEQRAAGQAREEAMQALIQAERSGVSEAQRGKLEKGLNDAEARAAERWPERIAGARAAVGDAQGAIREFSAEHLDELVAGLVDEGEAAAEALNAAAEAVVEGHRRLMQIAGQISATIHGAGIHVRPGDVSRSRADVLAREAARLLQEGGEVGPFLQHDPRPEASAA